MPKYKKLVRDNTPDIIRSNGERPIVRKLSKSEYKKELLKKLVEEAKEVSLSGDSKDELIKEIGDLQEVLLAMYEVFDLDCPSITKKRNKSKKKRGSFSNRVCLEGVK